MYKSRNTNCKLGLPVVIDIFAGILNHPGVAITVLMRQGVQGIMQTGMCLRKLCVYSYVNCMCVQTCVHSCVCACVCVCVCV